MQISLDDLRLNSVRVFVKGDEKLGGSIIDAEIAGQRTLLSYRADLMVKKLVFRVEGIELKNVRISAWQNYPSAFFEPVGDNSQASIGAFMWIYSLNLHEQKGEILVRF